MKYFIKTFGCQMNYSDSERIARFLEENKLKPASGINKADLVIFNTCGVRQTAEDRIYGQTHNVRKNNPRAKIIITGCIAHREDVQRRLKNKADLFVEIKNFPRQVASITHQVSSMGTDKKMDYLSINPKRSNNYQALVPIMTGCNNFCTYCVVPYARGREISRPVEDIIKEVKSLVKKGYKEITLLGQNVNSYRGRPLPSGEGLGVRELKREGDKAVNFSQLLKKINSTPGNFWIRFFTSHPKDMSAKLIETIARSEKICEHIHLPIQSGDNVVLKKMNRNYTAARYLKLIEKIRDSFEECKPGKFYAITADIIVGFPEETKKQFLRSAEIMEKVKYDMAYISQFSSRPETALWKTKYDVSQKEKKRREKYLTEILKKTALENNQKYIGKILKVLVEKQTPSPFRKGGSEHGEQGDLKAGNKHKAVRFSKGTIIYFGKTRAMKNVKFKSDKKNLIGKFVKVKITKANIWNLEGEI